MSLDEIGKLLAAARLDRGSAIELLNQFLDGLESQHSSRRVLIRHVHSILRKEDHTMFPIQTRHVESQRVMSIQRRLHASETDAFVAEAKAAFASRLGDSVPVGGEPPGVAAPREKVLLWVFVHFYGEKVVLLLGGYDKGKDPKEKRQQREIARARKLLAQFKERQRRTR